MLLICAATSFELATYTGEGERYLTGVGIPAVFESFAQISTLNLNKTSGISGILNIGIAGAYPETGLEIGDIVLATSEV